MSGPARFKTVDGLRGIAALAVVAFHLNGAVRQTFGQWLPASLDDLLAHGYLGVDVFFVLSGFVIAYSIRNAQATPRFLGRFALRRSLRLDPPYWVAILLEVALVWIGLRIGLASAPMPHWDQVASHFLYLQNLLGYGDLNDVFWTLCFEIQFYLGLVLLLMVFQALAARLGNRAARGMAFVGLGALFLGSLAVRFGVLGASTHPGFALIRWFQFFMGVCVFWVIAGKAPQTVLVALWAVTAGVVVAEGQPWYQLLPIAVSGLLLWSYRKDRMSSLLSSVPIQFLGAISYSLYLFHASIGWRLIRVTGIALHGSASRPLALIIFAGGIGVSILIAWVLWRLLEQPALRLSRRINLDPSKPAIAPYRPIIPIVPSPAAVEEPIRRTP